MSYEIYLVDSTSSIKLDTDNFTMSTTFSVADLTDISLRKDTLTKYVVFKGTKTNNSAFGSLFHLNRVTDSTLDNKLFFNYNPLRTVDTLVYEDGMLLFKGNLRVREINIKEGQIYYTTVITGHFIELKSILDTKKLNELDFSDLTHHYKWATIQDSWATRTERYDSGSSTFIFEPFSMGSGYMYPYIDYGHIFKKNEANSVLNLVHGLNFRPALFLREILNRIFNQAEVDGFTYEIKGDADFIEQFDSIIIPNADEKVRNKFQGFNLLVSKPLIVIENQTGSVYTIREGKKLLPMNNISAIPIPPILSHLSPYFSVFNIDRTFVADSKINVSFSWIKNSYNSPMVLKISLVERELATDDNPVDDWTVIGEKSMTLPGYDLITFGVLINQFLSIDIAEREWNVDKQIGLLVTVTSPIDIVNGGGGLGPQLVLWDVSGASMEFPKNTSTPFTVELDITSNLDVVVPTVPENITQMDFIKNIMLQHNFYAYTEKKRPKHLIFERYNDYWALTQSSLLKTTALSWTNKIDYTDLVIRDNVDLPKSYKFTYKDDSDFINADYKKAYGEPYGTFSITDGYGTAAEKKVELIFSPSPLVQYAGTGKIHPAIYKVDNNNKKPVKSNIRMLYYNGLKNSNTYDIGSDGRNSLLASIVNTIATGITNYPQVGNYYLESGASNMTPVLDMYWGIGKTLYFSDVTSAHINCPTAFDNYYRNQIYDLTNSNVVYFDCNVNLNELDITNLDLKVPVFVDLGREGHAYFKVTTVEYNDNKTLAKVQLQKIYLGDKR